MFFWYPAKGPEFQFCDAVSCLAQAALIQKCTFQGGCASSRLTDEYSDSGAEAAQLRAKVLGAASTAM